MRVAVMGTGGLGGVFGALLAEAGSEVLFIARGAQLNAMQSSGLRVLSELGDITLPNVHVTADPKEGEAADFVLFTVKGQDTKPASELIAPLVGPETSIVSFQNGVEGLDILAARYNPEAVIPGTTMMPATIEAPGVIRHFGQARPITIGSWHGTPTEQVREFAALCGAAGLEVTVSENIHVDVWTKFVAMATFSALTCLTRLPVPTIASHPDTRRLAADAANEVMALAKARGVQLAEDTVDKVLSGAASMPASWKTSMCNDLEAGRKIEVDSISGAVHRLGEQFGIPTPVHTVALRALKPYAAETQT